MTDESTNAMPEEPAEPMPAPEPPPAPEPVEVPAPPMPEPPAAPEPEPMAAPVPPAPPAPPAAAPVAPPAAAPAAPAYAPPTAPPPPPAPGYAPPQQPGYASAPPASDKQKVVAGLLAILLGSFGAHKFYLGYKNEGIILLAVYLSGFVLTFLAIGALWVWVPGVIGLIEGILYLTKTDEEFYATYVAGRKPWF